MQTTAAEQVYAHLLSRILHNELKPGDWVERKQLAEGMKTSLMPIAEAVDAILHRAAGIDEAIAALMARPLREEG